MNPRRIGIFGILIIVACPFHGTVCAAQPDNTTFAFQGILIHNNVPVTDECDFQASLWDSEFGGTMVAQTLVNQLDVVSGLFELPLDFGAAVFDGQGRWLLLETRCPGDSGFLSIGPREPISPVPYAIHTRGIDVAENGDAQVAALFGAQAVELSAPTPYVDFHFGNSPADFNARIINSENGTLALEASKIYVPGSVGIGTSVPNARLDVAGPIAINGIVVIDATGHWVGASGPPTCGTSFFPECQNAELLICGTSSNTYNGPEPTQQQENNACSTICACGYLAADSSSTSACNATTPSGVSCSAIGETTRSAVCGPPGCTNNCNYAHTYGICCVCRG